MDLAGSGYRPVRSFCKDVHKHVGYIKGMGD
jgi:hypothetical protein